MKIMTSIAIMMAAMTTALCGCTDKTVMQTDGDGNATSANDSFRIDMTRAVPGQYLSEATQQGQVVRIEYESKDYTRDDRPATRKPAYVYLPYGYDESRQYNVVYLMHGWTGTAEDTFGALGGAQKNILDWMIQQGDCQPVIVVSPTWDKDNQAKGWGESCEEIAVFHNEYENDLIPAVESRFATFAETTDRAGIVASRDHRAFGGFSLGSVTTWYVFEHCFDLQRFFLPMSGDSWHVATFGGQTAPEQTARFLATVVRSSPFGTDNGFHVWHAVGTRDARFYQTHNQAMACMQLTDVFTPHNFSYHQREGGLHDYNSVVEFVYNALPFFFPAETGQAFTSTSRISDVMDDPAFGDWGRLVFHVDDGYWSGETLGQLRMAWYNYIDPDKTVEICNYLKSHADSVFIDIYTEAEKQADPQKRNTGLFFFRGNHGAPFAICNAGGAFAYVGAMHDSFPHALELSKLGYNAFALIYRPDHAYEDLARAITYIHDNADALGVRASGYSLWGGSAGARMAAALGNADGLRQLTGRNDMPQASAVVMQYTGYGSVSRQDAPTYACVGTNDGIAPWRTMQNRLQRLAELGIPTEFHAYEGLPHGFGLGTGTVAEGWLADAVGFWEAQTNN